MTDFPQVVVEIFYGLPVKSLCRFKCVSKPLRALISDPHFVKTHLTRHKKQRAIIFSNPMSLYYLFSIDFDESFDDNVAPKILDFVSVKCDCLWGSCNGLVLLADRCESLVILNPATRIYKKLPLPSFNCFFYYRIVVYGFGYDSSNDDYKVVQVSYEVVQVSYNVYPISNNPTTDGKSIISVYYVKFRTWKECPCDPSLTILSRTSGVFANGSLHWVAERGDRSRVIAAFDLAVEKLVILLFPTSLNNHNPEDYALAHVGGCLCLYNCCTGFARGIVGERDVWLMKEYGVVESWIKISIFHLNMYSIRPFPLLSGGCLLVELMFLKDPQEEIFEYKWVVSNDKGETMREIFVGDICETSEVRFSFVESLVSPFTT